MRTATPSTLTSPAVGVSSPPSRCSSVLLPEPDAPTIAMRSPCCDGEVDAGQHRHGRGAAGVGLRQPAAARTGTSSLIAQRLRRVDARRLPRRIHRGRDAAPARARSAAIAMTSARCRSDGSSLDVVDRLVEEVDAEACARRAASTTSMLSASTTPPSDAERDADDPDQRALHDEDRHDRRRPRPERAQDRDVGLLVGHHHHLRRHDVERGHRRRSARA